MEMKDRRDSKEIEKNLLENIIRENGLEIE